MDEKTTILTWAPFIEGKEFFSSPKSFPRITMEDAVRFGEKVRSDQVASQLFDMCEKDTDFFSMHVDAKTWIPKELQSEAFYTLKIGKHSADVPSFCVYMLERAWKHCDGIPNLITRVLSSTQLIKFLSKDYLGRGYCLKDVICSVCDETYEPLSEFKTRIRHNKYTEIYIEETNMVAAVPNDIADELTDAMIKVIRVTSDGLAYGGTLLRTMGGHYGITNSVYDLRELV